MTGLDRFTIATNVFMTGSSVFSATLSTGHAWHIVCAVLWACLAVWNWHNARFRARNEKAARLLIYADALVSVAEAVQQPDTRAKLGPMAASVSIGAYEAAAEVRAQAAVILRGSP